MKKMFVVWCMVMVAAILMGVVACASAETYALSTVVVSVDYDSDVVECVDFNGNVWAFDGCEDWFVGDVASMIMEDVDTDIIFDDVIVSVRYDGWIEGWMDRVCD